MDVTTKAVALRATDYKENDKLLLLYSLEYGKITVHAKGIRKSGAKLRFAADQFCFGQYDLAQSGDRYTLKTCEQLESFYNLREDIAVYYAACTVAECLVNCTDECQSDPELFVETLKVLQALCGGSEVLRTVLCYMLAFCRNQGVTLQWGNCVACGNRGGKMYLDMRKGGLVCDNCRDADCYPVSAGEQAALAMLDGMPYDKLGNLSVPSRTLKGCLDIMSGYFNFAFSPLRSLAELRKLA